MKLTHEQAVAVLKASQFETAETWTEKKIRDKINKLDEAVDEDTELGGDKDTKKLVKKVLKAIEAEEEIEVGAAPTKDAPAAKGKAAKGGGKPAKAAKAEPEEEEEEEEEEEAEEEADEEEDEETVPVKKKTAKKKAAAAKEKPPKKDTIPGVRVTRSRPYLAGIIIKQAAAATGEPGVKGLLKCGVTPEMVTQLNEAYGQDNNNESMFALRNAWGAIRGFNTKGNEGDLEATEAEE